MFSALQHRMVAVKIRFSEVENSHCTENEHILNHCSEMLERYSTERITISKELNFIAFL